LLELHPGNPPVMQPVYAIWLFRKERGRNDIAYLSPRTYASLETFDPHARYFPPVHRPAVRGAIFVCTRELQTLQHHAYEEN
jgi:hypothetical protein